jgi:hypothetical protein
MGRLDADLRLPPKPSSPTARPARSRRPDRLPLAERRRALQLPAGGGRHERANMGYAEMKARVAADMVLAEPARRLVAGLELFWLSSAEWVAQRVYAGVRRIGASA